MVSDDDTVAFMNAASATLPMHERRFIVRVYGQHAGRVAVLLSAYGGQRMTAAAFGQIMLAVARRVDSEPGGAS